MRAIAASPTWRFERLVARAGSRLRKTARSIPRRRIAPGDRAPIPRPPPATWPSSRRGPPTRWSRR